MPPSSFVSFPQTALLVLPPPARRLLCCCAGFLLASVGFAAIPFSPDAEGVMVIEAETVQLTAAKVVDDDGASGGKAVLMQNAQAGGAISLSLPKGIYVFDVRMAAPDPEADGLYLVADSKTKRTAAPHHRNTWVYGTKFLVFESDGRTPVTLQFTSSWTGLPGNESGMMVDRMEVVVFEKAAYRLERWTD